MNEKIKVVGRVKSVSDPFKRDFVSLHLITIETDKGLFSIPVKNPSQYKLNEVVQVSVKIKSKKEYV